MSELVEAGSSAEEYMISLISSTIKSMASSAPQSAWLTGEIHIFYAYVNWTRVVRNSNRESREL